MNNDNRINIFLRNTSCNMKIYFTCHFTETTIDIIFCSCLKPFCSKTGKFK